MRPCFYKMIVCPCLVVLCLHLWPTGASVLKGNFSVFSAHSVWAAENDILDDDDYLFDDDDYLSDDFDEETEISDPLEPLNRAFFYFNDKMYFWVLKPVAQGYSFIVPEVMRGCIENAFNNLLAPIRVVNTLLQGKVRDSGKEVSRFLINSTIGILGMADPAKDEFGLHPSDEDFGQTLATYGIGNGFYICWPILGPSTLRDSVGMVGDSFLDPIHYLYQSDSEAGLAVYAGKEVNYTSLVIGDYEAFVEASFDPYIAMRDAYIQYRQDLIKDRGVQGKSPISASLQRNITARASLKQDETVIHGESSFDEQSFFVQVGTCAQAENVRMFESRLLAMNKKVIVVEYVRGDYSFYGVQIPVQGDFLMAKLAEEKLVQDGFPDAFVVSR